MEKSDQKDILDEMQKGFNFVKEEFGLIRSEMRDQFQVMNTKLNTLAQDVEHIKWETTETKSDVSIVKDRLGNLEDEAGFVKEYLMENLDTRVNLLEGVVR